MRRSTFLTIRGIALVETIIAASIGGAVIAAIVFGAVSLQRTFTRASDGFRATAAEMLLADYMVSDLRSALTVKATAEGRNHTLTLTVPDYLNPQSFTPRNPTLTPGPPAFGKVTGKVDYGDSAAPITITYSVVEGQLVRTEGKSATVLSQAAETFQVNVNDRGGSAEFSIQFPSRFARQPAGDNGPAVVVSDTVQLRNLRRDQPPP